MPEAVIDGFEMIEVNHHHRQRMTVPPGPTAFVLPDLQQAAAVWKTGERVTLGQALHPAKEQHQAFPAEQGNTRSQGGDDSEDEKVPPLQAAWFRKGYVGRHSK